jgi:hypothetical protein
VGCSDRSPPLGLVQPGLGAMTQLHDLRLRLLVQQESERIAESQPTDLDLSVVQARCLCWLALLAEAHEDQASDAERRGDTEQAMGWFADSMRLRDVIGVVSSIEIPLPDTAGEDGPQAEEDLGPQAA